VADALVVVALDETRVVDAQRTFVVVNPSSAGGATRRRWPRIAARLRTVVGRFDVAFTRQPLDATRLTREALQSRFRRIVAVGGDGTLNEVVCGYFEADRPIAADAAVGILPCGTGKDFARTLGATDLDARLASLARASRLVDVGWARFTAHDGAPTERLFVNEISFGCSGRVTKAISPIIKRASGALAFTLATLRTLLTYRDQPVSISLDAERARDHTITNGAFCNGQFFGGGMRVAPAARIDDGELDVTLWSGYRLLDFVTKRQALLSGAHVAEPGTLTFRARRATVTSTAPVLVELDGESVGRLPLEVRVLPNALRLLA